MSNDPENKLAEMGTPVPKAETAHEEKRQPLVAGNQVQAFIPTTIEDAYRMAQAVVQARMAPRGIDTPQQAMVAIMMGAEVGMTPMQSIQRIAVIGGRPTIWGDAAIGLVRASGLLGGMQETIEGEGDAMTAVCKVSRKGDSIVTTATFSVADAKQAGLWGKSGPWSTHPKRMLQMRARGFALRDTFADVLGGLYLREEIDEHEMRDVTPEPEPSNVVPLKAEGIIATSNPTAAYTDAVRDTVGAAAEAATERVLEPEPETGKESSKSRETAKEARTSEKAPKRRGRPRKTAKAADDANSEPDGRDFAAEGKSIRAKFWKADSTEALVTLWNNFVEPESAWPGDELAPVIRTYKERLAALEKKGK